MRVYLDYNSGAPTLDKAREAMLGASKMFGNASSIHSEGRKLRACIEQARTRILNFAGKPDHKLIFTANGSEAINLAIFGSCRGGLVDNVIVSGVEHPCVMAAAANCGVPFQILPVDDNGMVDLVWLEQRLTMIEIKRKKPSDKKALVAIQAANSETGVIQNIDLIRPLVASYQAVLLLDTMQIAGKQPLTNWDGDFLTVSSHKIGGGCGAGALIVKPGIAGRMAPVIYGGGQESRLRSGSENYTAIAAFAAACLEVADYVGCSETMQRQLRLRDYIEQEITKIVPSAVFIGNKSERLASVVCFSIPGIRAETAVIAFDLAGIAISSGSACSSGKVSDSQVLAAMGFASDIASSSLRLSFGYATTAADIDCFLQALRKIYVRMSCSG